MNFENKTILITGASSGIGMALAEKLARIECNLILTARRREPLEKIKNSPANKARIEIIKCDVTNTAEVEKAYNYAKNCFRFIDIAILNAGVAKHITPENFEASTAADILNTNFMGVVNWTELLLKDYIEKREGMIVGISSLADNRAYGTTAYNPSKAALTIFLEGLRLDMKKFGVKVLTVKPGFVKTAMTDQNGFEMPFLLTTENAADRILKGIEKEKKIIQFPWQIVLLTRLIGLLPLSVYEPLWDRLRKK